MGLRLTQTTRVNVDKHGLLRGAAIVNVEAGAGGWRSSSKANV